MIYPYHIGYYGNSNDYMKLYFNQNGELLLISHDDEDFVYKYKDNVFSLVCSFMEYEDKDSGYEDLSKGIRPATRKELKAIGLWDMVVNKEDFSSIDDELDYYLELSEGTHDCTK